MDKPSEKIEIPSLRLVGWRIVEFLCEWSFMCHAGLVLLVAWTASYLHLNVALVCALGFLYLYQVKLLHLFPFCLQIIVLKSLKDIGRLRAR